MHRLIVTLLFVLAYTLSPSCTWAATMPDSPTTPACSFSLPSSPQTKPCCHRKARMPSMDSSLSHESASIIGEDDIMPEMADLEDKAEDTISTLVLESISPTKSPLADEPQDNLIDAILKRDLNTFSLLMGSKASIEDQINASYTIIFDDDSRRSLTPLQLVSELLEKPQHTEAALLNVMLRKLLAAGANPHACAAKTHSAPVSLRLACSNADKIDDAIQEHDHQWLASCVSNEHFKTIISTKYCSLYRHAQRQTALQTAVKTGCYECVSILLTAGACPITLPPAEGEHCNLTMPLNIALQLAKGDPACFTKIYNLLRDVYYKAGVVEAAAATETDNEA